MKMLRKKRKDKYLKHEEMVIHKYHEFLTPYLQKFYKIILSCIFAQAKKILALETIFTVHNLPPEHPGGLRHNVTFKSGEKT